MRTWLHSGHTGCFFAKTFAKGEGTKNPVLAITSAPQITTGLDTFFDDCATRSVPGLAIFPAVQTVADLNRLLEQLHRLPRWSCSTPSVPSFTRSADLWCSVRRVKDGPDRGAIGDMACSTSKRVVRDMARRNIKQSRDRHLSKPKVRRAPASNCSEL